MRLARTRWAGARREDGSLGWAAGSTPQESPPPRRCGGVAAAAAGGTSLPRTRWPSGALRVTALCWARAAPQRQSGPRPARGFPGRGATAPRSPGGGTSGCLAAPRCVRLRLSTWLVRATPEAPAALPSPFSSRGHLSGLCRGLPRSSAGGSSGALMHPFLRKRLPGKRWRREDASAGSSHQGVRVECRDPPWRVGSKGRFWTCLFP